MAEYHFSTVWFETTHKYVYKCLHLHNFCLKPLPILMICLCAQKFQHFVKLSSAKFFSFADLPRATMRCLPFNSINSRLSQSPVKPEFDNSTFQEVECGITFNDLSNGSLEDLAKLETLTSRSDVLNEENITFAAKLLASFEVQNVNITFFVITVSFA